MVTFNLFRSISEDTDTVSPYVYVALIVGSFWLSLATIAAIVLTSRAKIKYVSDIKAN